MGSEEEEFGILVAQSDGAGSKERKNARNGEDSVKRRAVNVGILGNSGRPVEEAVSGNVVCVALHIYRQAKRGNRGERSSKCPYRNSPVSDSRCRCG